MLFPRFVRLSRFNARAWDYQYLFAAARSKRVLLVAGLAALALAGMILLWPSRPAAQRAVERAVAWKSFAPSRSAARTTARRVTNTSKIPNTTKTAAITIRKSANKPAALRRPRPAARPAHPLGPTYIDEANGFAIRFPASWSLRARRTGAPWLLECGDARRGLISVGVVSAAAPADPPDSTLLARGSAVIAGRKATWNKSTGPLGAGTPAVTRVSYLLPLPGGKTLAIRLAAPAEQFDKAVTVMKQSVATFRLAAPARPAPALASTR